MVELRNSQNWRNYEIDKNDKNE